MKYFIVVEHRAHLLANRMWSDLSVRAAGYEYGARVVSIAALERWRWMRPLHVLVARLLEGLTRGRSLWALGAPKTLANSSVLRDQQVIYFFGWLFKDIGLMEKYRSRLVANVFSNRVRAHAAEQLAASEGKTRIGIRHRTRPFRGFSHGEYLVPRGRVDEIVSQYIEQRGLERTQVALVEVLDDVAWDDVVGLCALSQCSVVIGDNSTFSNLAAWLGNVPHIVTTNDPVDWDYYQDKKHYFENKYATFSHGSLKP